MFFCNPLWVYKNKTCGQQQMHTNINVRIIRFHPKSKEGTWALQKGLSHLYPKEISRVYPALELVLHKRNLIIVCVCVWERNETSLIILLMWIWKLMLCVFSFYLNYFVKHNLYYCMATFYANRYTLITNM